MTHNITIYINNDMYQLELIATWGKATGYIQLVTKVSNIKKNLYFSEKEFECRVYFHQFTQNLHKRWRWRVGIVDLWCTQNDKDYKRNILTIMYDSLPTSAFFLPIR